MRISSRDKYQAIKRSAQYRWDYKQYRNAVDDRAQSGEMVDALVGRPGNLHLKLSPEAKNLCLKYDILYPINPDAMKAPDFFVENSWMIQPIITHIPKKSEWRRWGETRLGGPETGLIREINGKIAILIDPSFSKKDIHAALDDFLKHYPKDKGRVRKSEIDIWKVYDLSKEGKEKKEIVIEFFGKWETPAYDEETAKNLKRVNDALDKAQRIINFIEK